MLAVCGCQNNVPEVSEDTSGNVIETQGSEDEGPVPGIPSDLRYDGRTFRILATGNNDYLPFGPDLDEFELDKNADVLNQALYDRLIKTEERFGIGIDITYGEDRNGAVLSMARSSVNAGSEDYELVSDVASWHRGGIYEGLYTPVYDLTYIDLDKPWWNKNYITSVSVDPENPYFLFGAINHKSIERSACAYFNMDMLEERLSMTEQEMYDLVLDGKWTLDKMTELSRAVYEDKNGNTLHDMDDIYGFTHYGFEAFYAAYSSGLEFVTRDEYGLPVLSINNEKSVELADKLLALFNDGTTFKANTQVDCFNMFAEDRVLFYINRFAIAGWPEFRQSTVRFGIIPVPKFDESIDNYYGAVADNTMWQMVPVTVSDLDFASVVTEYLAYLGYKDVVPAYYDITLKFKYTRGDLDGASRMLDLIVENQRNDFMSVNDLGGMQDIFNKVVNAGTNTFASRYAMMASKAEYMLRDYIDGAS